MYGKLTFEQDLEFQQKRLFDILDEMYTDLEEYRAEEYVAITSLYVDIAQKRLDNLPDLYK